MSWESWLPMTIIYLFRIWGLFCTEMYCMTAKMGTMPTKNSVMVVWHYLFMNVLYNVFLQGCFHLLLLCNLSGVFFLIFHISFQNCLQLYNTLFFWANDTILLLITCFFRKITRNYKRFPWWLTGSINWTLFASFDSNWKKSNEKILQQMCHIILIFYTNPSGHSVAIIVYIFFFSF